jgi:phosphoserine / homoserine phosphotransferase
MLTTRDVSNYDELMTMRINTLKENNLNIRNIEEIVANTDPLP